MMDLSIVIVNFKTFELTSACIRSICDTVKGLTFEIIVVDNHSEDGSVEKLRSTFPAIQVISLSSNIGFGGANNIGISRAKGKYYLLLNSDTEILNNCLEACFQFMESHYAHEQNIGLLGCKFLNEDRTFQMSVLPYRKNFLLAYLKTSHPVIEKLATLTGRNHHRNFDPAVMQYVGDVSGAFMFMRKQVVEATGVFDENFFMYSEDSEWCQDRIGKKFNIVFFPGGSIVHLGGRSAPQDLMYIQSKLSLSLLWYKRGPIKYLSYLFATVFTILTALPFVPFMSVGSRKNYKQFTFTYGALIRYLLFTIPAFVHSKEPGKKLIYHKIVVA